MLQGIQAAHETTALVAPDNDDCRVGIFAIWHAPKCIPVAIAPITPPNISCVALGNCDTGSCHTSASVIPDRTYWLLGLPFDAVDMEEAARRVQSAAALRKRLIVVTPNVNFVSMAGRDAGFLEAVLDSQLSLVDGMPLVWLGRRSGIPFPQRVAGSSLLYRLAHDQHARPLRAYFFGGEPGVSETAARRLPDFGPGLEPAGFLFPGFGSMDSMSTPDIIDRINAARPDLLILSLGAKKGHQWIARNKHLLEAPVITHLGAAVNFVAGTLRRAPEWMQKAGLEWSWRISQEPQLLGRYWNDGLFFLRAVSQHAAAGSPPGHEDEAFRADPGPDGSNQWTLRGSLAGQNAARLEEFLRQTLAQTGHGPLVDLAGITGLDARSLGLLYAYRYRCASGLPPRLVCSSSGGLRLLRRHRAECLLSAALAATPVQ
jgi:N-acetylglucosaminyldiphosphoundecaprenol N-acetyl-beta-D-mannosaminyltransferase